MNSLFIFLVPPICLVVSLISAQQRNHNVSMTGLILFAVSAFAAFITNHDYILKMLAGK